MEWVPVYHIKGWGKFNRNYGDFCTGADIITGLARSFARFASILIGAHAGRGDYRSMILTALMVVFVIANYYFYERRWGRGKNL